LKLVFARRSKSMRPIWERLRSYGLSTSALACATTFILWGVNFHLMRSNFHLMGKPTASFLIAHQILTAAARRPAAHAAVAAPVADHDGAAGGATGSIAHLIHLAHGVGRMIDAAILQIGPMRGAGRRRVGCVNLRRNAAASGQIAGLSADLSACLPACLIEPLGYLFGQPGQVMLRSDLVLLQFGFRKQAGRSRQLRNLQSQTGKQC